MVDVPLISDFEIKHGTERFIKPEEEIPKEIREEASHWNTLADKYLNNSISDVILTPMPGVDPIKALSVVMATAKANVDYSLKRMNIANLLRSYFIDWKIFIDNEKK